MSFSGHGRNSSLPISGLRTSLALATAAAPKGSELILAPEGSYLTFLSKVQLAQDHQCADEEIYISHTDWSGAFLGTEEINEE